MESTGSYWQNLHAVLLAKGFHVVLCNGKFTKNIKGKKSDVMDCQWIQKLHTPGLLSTSFLPEWADRTVTHLLQAPGQFDPFSSINIKENAKIP